MAVKRLDIPPVGLVAFYKRRDARSIRLSIAADGEVRITLPTWAPYRVGVEFVRTKQAWIMAHRRPTRDALQHGDCIGQAHRLIFQPSAGKISSRIVANEIRVKYPANLAFTDKTVQAAAERACLRSLKKQAEVLLSPRLQVLAKEYNLTYKSMKVKRLKSRWGSCDSYGNITLNLFLMQLPWELIDYVLLHELVHTEVLRHGPPFWRAMQIVLPDTPELRRGIRKYQPQLKSTAFAGHSLGLRALSSEL